MPVSDGSLSPSWLLRFSCACCSAHRKSTIPFTLKGSQVGGGLAWGPRPSVTFSIMITFHAKQIEHMHGFSFSNCHLFWSMFGPPRCALRDSRSQFCSLFLSFVFLVYWPQPAILHCNASELSWKVLLAASCFFLSLSHLILNKWGRVNRKTMCLRKKILGISWSNFE